MLHEILLGLAGHPSPLFAPDTSSSPEAFPGVTEAEKALLKVLSSLAFENRFLRRHTQLVSRTHPSVVCRAVAASIFGHHLSRFQQHILDVEKRILQTDAGIVGAYNIVPLAAIVAEFEPWQRSMEWYCKVAVFMKVPDTVSPEGSNFSAFGGATTKASCSAAQLINRLRTEAQTGFPQIERIANELGKVAETAWLRQVSSWILYGKFPPMGNADFFVVTSKKLPEGSLAARAPSAAGNTYLGGELSVNNSLVPKFVARETAESIFALGRTLHSVRAVVDTPTAAHIVIVPDHARILAQLQFPLTNSSLMNTIEQIRQSFSCNVLRSLLPLPRIQQLMAVLHEFFLLARGEFAICLVSEAEQTLKNRSKLHNSEAFFAPDILLRDSEIPPVLSRTWTVMLTFVDNDGIGDTQMDFARDVLLLQADTGPSPRTIGTRTPSGTFVKSAKQPKHFHEPPSFHDLLLNPTPVALTLRVPPPLDLFIGDDDIRLYSDMHAYLLSIRRAHIRLSDLWRHSLLRRTMPSSRSLFSKRLKIRLRPTWATCMTATFVLSGMMEYFSDSVVRAGWTELMARIEAITVVDGESLLDGTTPRHDPEAIMVLHREFLQSLYLALLLDDEPFTSILHALLSDVDAFVSAIIRLEQITSQVLATSGDEFDDEEEEDATGGVFANSLTAIYSQLERDRQRTQSGVRKVVQRLRSLSQDGRESSMKIQMGGIERLLTRLHFAGTDSVLDVDVDNDDYGDDDANPDTNGEGLDEGDEHLQDIEESFDESAAEDDRDGELEYSH